jgi:hypothetical protein
MTLSAEAVRGVSRLRRRAPGASAAVLRGYLLGRAADALVIHALGPSDAARAIFSPSAHAWNAVSWAALALLVLAAALRITRPKPPAGAESLLGFHGPWWDTAVTLQMCPAIREGWPVAAVQIYHTPKPFTVPDAHAPAYREYVQRHYLAKRFFDDQVKVMLTDNPVAFSDSPTLVLHTQETLHSIVQYYHERVATVPAERAAFLDALAQGTVRFPNSLCLEAVVLTRDDQVRCSRRDRRRSRTIPARGRVRSRNNSPSTICEPGRSAPPSSGAAASCTRNWGSRTTPTASARRGSSRSSCKATCSTSPSAPGYASGSRRRSWTAR